MSKWADILHYSFLHQAIIVEQKSLYRIAEEVGCNHITLRKYARQCGLVGLIETRKRYKNNEDFFKLWSPDMSYILGFTTADGYICESKRSLMYDIKRSDEMVLDYIRSHICPKARIKRRDRYDKRTLATYYQSHLSINSTNILHDLSVLGVVPRKTGREWLPSIPEKYRPDYLRGLFDGDGTLYIGTNGPKKYPRFAFSVVSASHSFISDVREQLGMGMGCIRQHKTWSTWHVDDMQDVATIGRYMYNGQFCLQRKLDKFTHLFEHLADKDLVRV